MNSKGEGSKTESVEEPLGSHTVKEAERESQLAVVLTVIATASREAQAQSSC